MKRRTLIQAASGFAALAGVAHVRAQSAPPPAKIICPFAPGAGSDAMARYIAAELGKAQNRTYVVDNRAGAGGALGADLVAKSAPDGQTLLFIASPFTTVAATDQQPHYDPGQFAPIAIMGAGPLLFAAHPSLPGNDLKEAIAHIAQNPGKYNYGSAGNGSINHLIVELLKEKTRTSIVHIPYKGIAPATTDVIAGQLQIITGTVPALMPFIREGKLKALAVTTRARSPGVPGVPGMGELGYPDFDVNNYWGLMAPPGTPAAIYGELNAIVNKLIVTPTFTARLRQDATEPSPMEPAAITSFLTADVARWRSLIKAANLSVS